MKKALLLDLDGVLVKNKRLDPFPDAPSFLEFLRNEQIPFRIVSNNSRVPPPLLLKRLNEKGLKVEENELLTALAVAPSYLRRFKSVFAFAEEQVKDYLKKEGVSVVDAPDAEAVLVGQNHSLSFKDFKYATTALKRGAELVAVNLNKLAKDSDGLYYPASGALAKSFALAVDYPEEKIVSLGKPSGEFFKKALEGFENFEVLFVSDDFYTDLIPAERLGLKTIFITTGKYSLEDLKRANYQPFKVVNSLSQLREFLKTLTI